MPTPRRLFSAVSPSPRRTVRSRTQRTARSRSRQFATAKWYKRGTLASRTMKQGKYGTADKLATKYLQVYMNPFSEAAALPRIPDGKAVTSVGFRQTVNTRFRVEDQVTHVLFWPGLNTVGAIWQTGGDPAQDPPKPRLVKTIDVTDTNGFKWTSRPITDPAGGAIFSESDPTSQIHRWRTVSAGMHVVLTNNAETNDGTWEAIRLGVPSDAREWLIAINNATKAHHLIPYSALLMQDADLTRNPTYDCGALRNIGAVNFNLLPEGNDHDFINVRNQETLKVPENVDDATGKDIPGLLAATDGGVARVRINQLEAGVFTTDLFPNNDFIRQNVDYGYDMIYLRIQGRWSAVNPVENSGLQILSVNNQEIIYDERAINSRFHQHSVLHPRLESTRVAMTKRNKKASKIPKITTRRN